ncbi:hypothetical protein B0H19DRAFT_1267301 [Mycena capillaripes]|nr:hypothetical protein B0H19DRAFT_1267301 [Mycena capillaripes]
MARFTRSSSLPPWLNRIFSTAGKQARQIDAFLICHLKHQEAPHVSISPLLERSVARTFDPEAIPITVLTTSAHRRLIGTAYLLYRQLTFASGTQAAPNLVDVAQVVAEQNQNPKEASSACSGLFYAAVLYERWHRMLVQLRDDTSYYEKKAAAVIEIFSSARSQLLTEKIMMQVLAQPDSEIVGSRGRIAALREHAALLDQKVTMDGENWVV